MARQFSGTATFEFRRDGADWIVAGHFFDDIGRSGQIALRQVLTVDKHTAEIPATAAPGARERPVEPLTD